MQSYYGNSMDRRQFMAASLAAGMGMAGAAAALEAEEKKSNDPFGGFALGAQSYTFRKFDRERCLKFLQELGLKNVEFYQAHAPRESTPTQIKAILNQCQDYGVKPVAWGVQRFTKDADDAKKSFEFGKALGITSISADPEPDSFDALDKLCEEYKIAIAIHPHGPQGKNLHQWYSAEKILKAVKDHHPLIGACLDTGHLIRSAMPPFNKQLDPVEQVKIMGARNFGMHLKDHDNKKDVDVVFGKGVLDIHAILKALLEVKFKGSLSIEYEAHEDDPMPDVKACVEVFKDAVRRL